ncbi:MAG: DUF1588 domain-containing protein [Bradymonadaceae bacterium]|nr:DUF1588 domain-containing protein [Lujinxingiaceae bacterium]
MEVTTAHLRRLTSKQYENTLRQALGDVFERGDLPRFGDDSPTIGMNNSPSNLRVNDINVESIYASTQGIARAAVINMPSVRDCVAASTDTCFGQFVDEIGHQLWRRPVATEERNDLLNTRAQIAQAPATRAEQAEFLVQALLVSPHTMYRTELGQGEGKVVALTDYELASALAYTLWNAPPDDELYALAAQGALSDRETLIAQANRMAADQRVAEALAAFFIDYLKLEAVFAQTKAAAYGLTEETRASLFEGVRSDLVQIFSMPGASLLDPFKATNFHVDSQSASFFGVPVVASGSFEVIAMDPAQRLGVLSHPAFLSVHAGAFDSGIVKRGVFTLEQLLCVPLGAPPPDISARNDVPAEFNDAQETSREVLSVRHSSQATCIACHRMIDPAGFGYENYDAVGRYRLVEKENVQIDASGELVLGQELLAFNNSVEYIAALANSEALRSCLSDQFFTYVLGDAPRREEREAIYTKFNKSNGAIDELVEAIVTTPSFTARQVKETP